MTKQKHVPVLAQEVLAYLDPKPGDQYLDLTAGYGGHSGLIADRIGEKGSITLVDRDAEAVKVLREVFAEDSRVEIIQQDFLTASKDLLAKGKKYDIVFADLGVSSPHLDNAVRGFSFNKEGPLDMRMDRSQSLTAEEVVNTYSQDSLAKILRDYGDVRNANKIAGHLIEHRPYKTTTELANKVTQFIRHKKRTHPATEIFQALRIAVNSEIELLEKSVINWVELLKPQGRIGVISFHSLEDRIVKQTFAEYGGDRYDAKLKILTKRVVTGSKEEIVFNPRSRSAKFRAAQRK